MPFTLSSITDDSRHGRKLGLLASVEIAAGMNVTIKGFQGEEPRAVATIAIAEAKQRAGPR